MKKYENCTWNKDGTDRGNDGVSEKERIICGGS